MTDDQGAEGVTIDVLRGAPSDEELAALIGVVSESYERESADAIADEHATRTAWSLSQRSLREPLRRDVGWGRFSG